MTENQTNEPDRQPGKNYLNETSTLTSWLFPHDHKRLALLYLVVISSFFAIGALFAVFMRVEMMAPGPDLFSAEFYSRLFTMHGMFMVFFFLLPAIPCVLGNFLIPMQIGARNMAFPRLNLLSWYLFLAGGTCLLWVTLKSGGIDVTWTLTAAYGSNANSGDLLLVLLGLTLASVSLLLTGINFLVTIHQMRKPGLSWGGLPLFVWAHYTAALLITLATPVFIALIALMGCELLLGVDFFKAGGGGDPTLMKKLFWIYARPMFYAMVLPALGIISQIFSGGSRRSQFGYPFIVGSFLMIAALGILTAVSSAVLPSDSFYTNLVQSFTNYLTAVPFALILANWLATLFRAGVRLHPPMLYALGAVLLVLIGGLTGLILSSVGITSHLHNTLFVIAHFHYLLAGGIVMAYLAGLHHWWPKIFGRCYSDSAGRAGSLILFVGLNMTFSPLFVLGYLGMPRRQMSYPAEFGVHNVLATAGMTILMLGYLLPVLYLLWSLRGKKALSEDEEQLPLMSSLEWQTSSPPPTENFVK